MEKPDLIARAVAHATSRFAAGSDFAIIANREIRILPWMEFGYNGREYHNLHDAVTALVSDVLEEREDE